MCTLRLRFVQQVDNHVALVHAAGVEVLADRERKLFLGDAPFGDGARHGGRVFSDAGAEDDGAEGVFERGGCVEAVGPAVTLEEGAVLSAPWYLQRHTC